MLERLQRLAISRAFRTGGNRTWVIIGTGAWLLRTANRLRSPSPEVVYRGTIEPGQQLVIDHQTIDRSGRQLRGRRRRR